VSDTTLNVLCAFSAAPDGRRDWLTGDQVAALYQLKLPPEWLRAYTKAHNEEISTGELNSATKQSPHELIYWSHAKSSVSRRSGHCTGALIDESSLVGQTPSASCQRRAEASPKVAWSTVMSNISDELLVYG